jgi:hypothetical protein
MKVKIIREGGENGKEDHRYSSAAVLFKNIAGKIPLEAW